MIITDENEISNKYTEYPDRTFADIYTCTSEAYKDIDIKILDLSVRSNNCLRNVDCHFISQLLNYSYDSLFRIRNMGRRSVEEISVKLGDYIRDNHAIPHTPIARDKNYQYSEQQRMSILAYLYNKPLHTDIANISTGDDDIISKCQQACDLLGRDICIDVYNNPIQYVLICDMFSDAFASQFRKQSIKSDLETHLSSIHQSLKKKTLKPFIDAYSMSTSKDTILLQKLCKPNTIIKNLPQCIDNIIDEQEIINVSTALNSFLKWLNFDLEVIKNNIMHAYNNIGERSVNIISLRISGKTLREIADEMNLTRERVRQIESKAIWKFWNAYNNQNYDLLSLVSAIREGDYVLTFSEIEQELGLEITQLIWMALQSKIIKNTNYRYDYVLDAIIYNNMTDSLSNGLHMTIIQALNMLPYVIDKTELPNILTSVSEQTGLPIEAIERKFEMKYSLRGQVYYSKRITIGHMCERVLKERFPNGYKTGELAEQNLFYKYIIELFGEESILANRAIDIRVSEVGVLCDRGRYIHPDYVTVDEAVLEQIDKYIEENNKAEVPFSEIFEALYPHLINANITNRYYLQGVIKKYRNRYNTSRDCIIKQYSDSTKIRTIYEGNPQIQQPRFVNVNIDANKVKEIITTHFKNGYRLSANIEFIKFSDFYTSIFNTTPDFEKEDLDRYLLSIAVVFDEIAYIYTDDVIAAVNDCIREIDTPCISIRLLFEQQHDKLYANGIYSPDMLKAFIEQKLHNISYRNDYVYLQDKASPSQIIRDVFNEKEIWTFDELYNRLPGLKQDTIRQLLNREGYVRIDKGKYTHLDYMDLPEDEGEKIACYIEAQLKERDYITASELDLTRFIRLNPHCSYTVIRDAVFNKFLSHTYCKRSQIITYPQKQQRISDILEQYCSNVETVTLKGLSDFETTLDSESEPHYALPAAYKMMIRVTNELFVADSKVSFDIDKIDEMISSYCREDILPLKNINDFSLFPFSGYTWNLYLLESFLMKYSRLFKHDARSINNSNIGVVVRKSFSYNDYDDILATALAYSTISLDNKEAAGNYLFDNGFLGKKRLGNKENKVLTKANEIRMMND